MNDELSIEIEGKVFEVKERNSVTKTPRRKSSEETKFENQSKKINKIISRNFFSFLFLFFFFFFSFSLFLFNLI